MDYISEQWWYKKKISNIYMTTIINMDYIPGRPLYKEKISKDKQTLTIEITDDPTITGSSTQTVKHLNVTRDLSERSFAIPRLKISNFQEIETIAFSSSIQVSELNISNCTNLKKFSYYDSPSIQAERLIISDCPNLEKIDCQNSPRLTSVEIDNDSAKYLNYINFGFCFNLEEFKINHNVLKNLKICDLGNTKLKSIDLRDSDKLISCMFYCNRNLKKLLLPEKAENLEWVYTFNTPNLKCVKLPNGVISD